MAHETDDFNRWEAGQQLSTRLILSMVDDINDGKELSLPDYYVAACKQTLLNKTLDKALIARAMTLPSLSYIGEMMLTLAVVLVAVVLACLIGVPLGILVAYNSRLGTMIKPVLDAMQTMPSFVYLIPAIMLFGLGSVPAVFATVIYATPPAIRLTNLAIRGVSKEMVEAGHAFGSTTWQILTKIELPQAFPTIMMGINQTTMMAMSMVVISSMIGAKGLGLNVLQAINRINIAMGFEAGISIVFLAITIDRITQGIADKYKYPR